MLSCFKLIVIKVKLASNVSASWLHVRANSSVVALEWSLEHIHVVLHLRSWLAGCSKDVSNGLEEIPLDVGFLHSRHVVDVVVSEVVEGSIFIQDIIIAVVHVIFCFDEAVLELPVHFWLRLVLVAFRAVVVSSLEIAVSHAFGMSDFSQLIHY